MEPQLNAIAGTGKMHGANDRRLKPEDPAGIHGEHVVTFGPFREFLDGVPATTEKPGRSTSPGLRLSAEVDPLGSCWTLAGAPCDENTCRFDRSGHGRMSAMREVAVGCCQFESIPGDVDANLARAEKSVAELAEGGAQLLVLPEMWSCSFPFPLLGAMAGRTPEIVENLRKWARDYGMVLVGSLPEEDGGTVYNVSYVVDSTGEIAGKYRKIHRFSLCGEDRWFGRGTSPLVCSTGVGKLGILICYDLRFPELARRLALDGAEILCVSALWPVERIDHWSLLLRSRAVENQLFVVGCNGCGKEGKLQYGGRSAVVSPTGNVLAEAGGGEEMPAAGLKMEEMPAFRKHITCFADRLPGGYGVF